MAYDYRRMLLAYIDHVLRAEGVTFLPDGAPCSTDVDKLNDDERAELERMGEEVEKKVNALRGLRVPHPSWGKED